jgi:K+/H+ antiporter YhaU regulatory subunit KhtT
VAEIKAQKDISLFDLDLWKKTDCTILGIKDAENKYCINPPSSFKISCGDRLIVMGSDAQISEAKKIV